MHRLLLAFRPHRAHMFTHAVLLGFLTISAHAQVGIITTYAGGGPNNLPALQANLGFTQATTFDRLGNLYIASSDQDLILRVDRTTGEVTIVAGNGTTFYYPADGFLATSVGLNAPNSVAVDGVGNVFIADSGNNAVRRVDSVTGIITTVAGDGGDCAADTDGLGDGCPALRAILSYPTGVAVDGLGNLFISDLTDFRIRRVDAVTGVITTFAGGGPGCAAETNNVGDGCPAASAYVGYSRSVAVDGSGNVFFAASSRIRRVDVNTGIITTVAGNGMQGPPGGDGGPATNAVVGFPQQLAIDVADNLFIADEGAGIRRVDAVSGIITTVAGIGINGYSGDGGPATSARLNFASGVAVDRAENLMIADTDNLVVRRVDASTGIITTDMGNGNSRYGGDGYAALSASFYMPRGVATDHAGNLFIADLRNNRIRRVDRQTGTITTVAGNGATGYSGDGSLATNASLWEPGFVAVDGTGNLFINDLLNGRIRRVDAITGIITTVAGNGALGFSGDGGPATSASIDAFGIALDHAGNMFIADPTNFRVRRVDALTGIISTVAGNGTQGFSGDGGPATSANIEATAVALDQAGNLFIVEPGNYRVRRVDGITQVITTVAGTGTMGYSGDGGPATSATFSNPIAIALDGGGDLFIADNNRVRQVDAATGVISTVAGNGVSAYEGDGGPATDASLIADALAIDGARNLFITDVVHNRVRVVPLGGTTTLGASPNPATAGQSVTLTATVTGISPTGTVIFTKNGIPLATVPVVNGTASYTQAYTWANTKTIVAEYSGDNINQPSTSSVLTLFVNPATSTTMLASCLNPAPVGQLVTLTATVTSSSGLTPPDGGLVTFTKSGVVVATVPLVSGRATYTQAFTVAGMKDITASYAGDVTNQSSASAPLIETVN